MKKESYYVDSCIWLNLFKKEGDVTKGVPYWKIAEEFFEKVKKDNNLIIISTIVIREILHNLNEEFNLYKEFIKKNKNIRIISPKGSDYEFARKYETKNRFNIGFYDYLHTAITHRLGSVLITRDKRLIRFAKKHIVVFKPENLFK